ncbi:MAG: cupredoxin domain-containing protein [Alphaproteobacteria bacterium]|nr:cupredoxin domain-containing protein [Alphaproteobacteria bacterium]
MIKRTYTGPLCAAALTLALSLGPVAHAGPAGHDTKGPDIGQKGMPANVTRTVEIVMYDNYYEPEELSLKKGETVRFVIRNAGNFVHEFNIGTPDMHYEHQPEMRMMMEHGVLRPDRIDWEAAKAMQASMGHGMHKEANSLLLEPGKSGEIVWRFPERTALEFACNVPGHYDSGMVGEIDLTR